MNRKLLAIPVLVLIGLLSLGATVASAAGLPSTEARPVIQATPSAPGFLYRGRLASAASPVNDTCQMVFHLYDSPGSGEPPAGGQELGLPITTCVTVSDGLFEVMLNEQGQFGADALRGETRYLQIEV